MLKCNVMFFAAGLGTRLRPFTEVTPKPCIGLNGIALGYYLIPYLEKINISNFVVNTFHLPEQVKNLYSPISHIFNAPVNFSEEKGYIKGSAGGLKQAENFFDKTNPILVCNSDEVLFTEENDFLKKALEYHHQEKNEATLIVIKHPEAGTKFGGIWADKNGCVLGIGKEKPKGVETEAWHFIGLQILDQNILNFISGEKEENIFYDVLIHHLDKKNIKIFSIAADWYETGNFRDYKLAEENIFKNELKISYYKNHLEQLRNLQKLSGINIRNLP